MWWTSSDGRINLEITKAQAHGAYHSGPCDRDIQDLRAAPRIKRQLAQLDVEDVRRELRGHGAWTVQELEDRGQNLDRLLWLACGDIVEEWGYGRKQ